MITRARLLNREGVGFIIQEGNWILIHYISPLFRSKDKWRNCKHNAKKTLKQINSLTQRELCSTMFLIFITVSLSESGIVILEITWCLALPLRSPEWNLWFGSCVSFSWNFGLGHIWFLRHTLLLNRFLLFLNCF